MPPRAERRPDLTPGGGLEHLLFRFCIEVLRLSGLYLKFAAAAFAASALAACGTLPSQGPLADAVAQGGAGDAGQPRYVVVDLSENTVSVLSRYAPPTFLKQFGDYRAAPAPFIGVGDSVAVTIWEAASGGLFSSPSLGGVTAGSHSAVIPEQIVSRDGAITVPYANRVRVAGLTPPEVERAIVRNLTGKAIEPQALVSVTRSITNSATVTGEVTNGARVPLSAKGDRILDVVAAAGGVRAPVHETFITLNRGERTATVPMQALLAHPRENVFVRPNDVLTLVRNPQTFSVFGATGRNAVVTFDALGITLEEAIAKSGGLIDQQANPEGVFLMRREPAALVRLMDPNYAIDPGQREVNVIYRANMREANTYFLARRLSVRDKDIVYVASSPFTEIQKLLTLFNTAASGASAVAAVRLYTKN